MLLVTRRSDVMERSSLSGRGFDGVLAALVGYSCDGGESYALLLWLRRCCVSVAQVRMRVVCILARRHLTTETRLKCWKVPHGK
jgi:hypothetical protein